MARLLASGRVPDDITPNRLTEALGRFTANRRDIIDLTESNPTRAGFEYPEDLLASLADPRALRYEPQPFGMFEARRAVAADYARRGVSVTADRIALTASTSEGYSLLFKILCEPGDEVLVPRPSYPLFEHLTRLDAVAAKPYHLDYEQSWSVDFDSLDRSVSDRTRAILVVSPNNPTGSFIKPAELQRLVSLCRERGAALIVDEVFADYELIPGATPVASQVLHVTDALVFALGGCSKSIGLPQVKLGWIAVGGPHDLVDHVMPRLEFACDSYLSVSTPVQIAAPALLERGAVVRDRIRARVVANYRKLSEMLDQAPACRLLRAEAGWSAVVQVPSFGPEEDLVLDLLTTADVLVHPGYFFDFARESYLIVSLLPPETRFYEGIRRILRHFDCSVSPA